MAPRTSYKITRNAISPELCKKAAVEIAASIHKGAASYAFLYEPTKTCMEVAEAAVGLIPNDIVTELGDLDPAKYEIVVHRLEWSPPEDSYFALSKVASMHVFVALRKLNKKSGWCWFPKMESIDWSLGHFDADEIVLEAADVVLCGDRWAAKLNDEGDGSGMFLSIEFL